MLRDGLLTKLNEKLVLDSDAVCSFISVKNQIKLQVFVKFFEKIKQITVIQF